MVATKLEQYKLEGLLDCIMAGIDELKTQGAATAAALNLEFAKSTGKVELTYGGMGIFNKGLEGSIGPPLMHVESDELHKIASALAPGHDGAGPTLLGQMELEHRHAPDSSDPFPSQMNEKIVLPKAQWAYVLKEPLAVHYHLDAICEKSHSRPVYGVLYMLEGKRETLCESAYEKLKKKLEANELTPEKLLEEVQALAPCFSPLACCEAG